MWAAAPPISASSRPSRTRASWPSPAKRWATISCWAATTWTWPWPSSVETKLPQAGRLDATQYALLTQACRAAKEALLGEKPPASQTVTVIGRGRSVIGNTLHAPLTPDDVKRVIFDGFFPVSGIDETPTKGAKGGLHEMGLPYVSDPGITRHMAAFLHAHARPGERLVPASILFNGGVFQPASLRARLLEVLQGWYGPEWSPLVLTNPSLDLAVALGSAYFGWLRHIGGKRIGGGIPRSYYVGLGGDEADDTRTVVCVVPQHLEEGQEIGLPRSPSWNWPWGSRWPSRCSRPRHGPTTRPATC